MIAKLSKQLLFLYFLLHFCNCFFLTVQSNQQNLLEETEAQIQSEQLFFNLEYLIDEQYTGKYHSLQSSKLFDYLESTSGTIDFIFINNPYDMNRQQRDLNSVGFILYDPVYHDGQAVIMQIPLDDPLNNTLLWESSNANISMAKQDKEHSFDIQTKPNSYFRIEVLNVQQDDPRQFQVKLEVRGNNFDFETVMDYKDDRLSTVGYCLFTTFIVCLQIVSAYFMVRDQNFGFFNKLSLTTIALCNIQDFYQTMIHIQYIMEANTFYLFYIIPAAAFIILFVIFDMKLLFLVWRSHYVRDIANPQELRKKLTMFYIKFYLGLFIYLALAYFFIYQWWMIILQHLIIFPQVIHNARKATTTGLAPSYIFGFIGLRLMFTIYQRLCPSNHFVLQPMPIITSIILLLFVIQVSWIYLQFKFGSRFFIPKFLQPNYFNYNYKLKRTEENGDLQCTICLQCLFEDSEAPHINQSLDSQLLDQVDVMKTPCNHYFHKECLTKWIDVKLECPTCRKALPVLM